MTRRRGILYATGTLILLAPPALWVASSFPSAAKNSTVTVAHVTHSDDAITSRIDRLIAEDPIAAVRLGHKRFEEQVDQYRFTLVKQERLGKKLSKVQEIEVRCRKSPETVYMLWQKNADQAKRAFYANTPDFVDDEGRALVRVEPAGAIARLFVSDLYVEMNGEEARKSSRRTIKECGFGPTFDLFEHYNAVAKKNDVLDVSYAGTSEVDGRPTYVIVRELPYEGPNGPYPDARMVMHLDQERLLPVAIYSYADKNENELLGSYVFTDVDLDPNFGADAFEF